MPKRREWLITDDTRRAYNGTTGHIVHEIDSNKEEMYRKGLPKEVQDFVQYNCLTNYSWISTYSTYRKLGSKEKMLDFLRQNNASETKKTYGRLHPSLRS